MDTYTKVEDTLATGGGSANSEVTATANAGAPGADVGGAMRWGTVHAGETLASEAIVDRQHPSP